MPPASATIRLQPCGRFHSDGTFAAGCTHDPQVSGERDVRGAGELESAFAFAFEAVAIPGARQIAIPARNAVEALAECGVELMPHLIALCSTYPHGFVVMATVEVDESVTP